MKNTAIETLTYEAFLMWHEEATARCTEGEWIAAPSQKFFEHWKRNRIEAANHESLIWD